MGGLFVDGAAAEYGGEESAGRVFCLDAAVDFQFDMVVVVVFFQVG